MSITSIKEKQKNCQPLNIQNFETTKEPKPNPFFKEFCTLTPVERYAGEPAIIPAQVNLT